MKADLFLLATAACVAGVFVYVFLGGLVVRAVNVLKPFGRDATFDDAEGKGVATAVWPVLFAGTVAVGLSYHIVVAAYRLSQWRPRPKSTLPGARVVKP
jgi:hypothetical protein